jgi:sugar/nucleoside kinase (ribokinase family)
MDWYDEAGRVQTLPALAVPPERVVDTSGAGDVFHGAYVYSSLADASKSWQEHFRFARAASAYKIQYLGNEAGLPTLADIAAAEREFDVDKRPGPDPTMMRTGPGKTGSAGLT